MHKIKKLPDEVNTPEDLAREIVNNPNLWGMYSIADGIHELVKRRSIAFGKYLAENGLKPYDSNAWENSDYDTASTEEIYDMFSNNENESAKPS